jgi:hypothetical protein
MWKKLITSMESVDAGTAKQCSTVRTVDKPLAWINGDRLLTDDVTIFGLRRYVVARRDDPPDVRAHLDMIENAHPTANVYAWCVEKDDGFWYLWIVWKETE